MKLCVLLLLLWVCKSSSPSDCSGLLLLVQNILVDVSGVYPQWIYIQCTDIVLIAGCISTECTSILFQVLVSVLKKRMWSAGQSVTRSAFGSRTKHEPRENPIADWSILYIRFSKNVARTWKPQYLHVVRWKIMWLVIWLMYIPLQAWALPRLWKVWGSRSDATKVQSYQPPYAHLLPDDLTHDHHGGLPQLERSVTGNWT